MPPIVTVSETPRDEDREAIFKALVAFNDSKTGDTFDEKVAILLRDSPETAVLGGLWASLYYDWLFVELLFVPEVWRGQGFGSRLIRLAEDRARHRGCVGIWLDTFAFQARGFYERHGYELFGELADYPRGSHRYFMRKHLSA